MWARGSFDRVDVLRARPSAWRDGIAAAEAEAADGGRSRLAAAQATDMTDWLPHDLLLKLDRCLMAHAVEGRTPFLDPGVAKAAFRLPDAMKLRDGVGKWILRKWLEKHLPVARPFAPKQGFTVPVGEWIKGQGSRLGPLVAAQPGVAEIADPAKVRRCSATSAAGGTASRAGSCCSTRCGTGGTSWGCRRRGTCSRRWRRFDQSTLIVPASGPFGALHDAHPHRLALLQRTEAGTLQHRRVDEHVLAARLRGDEAEPLVGVVPLHRAHHLDGGAEIHLPSRSAALEAALRALLEAAWPARGRGGRGALIDRHDLIDLLPFLPLADADPERGARADGLDAGRLQRVDVQEHVARAIAQRHKTVTLLGVEPLDRRLRLRSCRAGGERGKRHWRRRIAVKVVVVKTAAAWRPLAVVPGRSQGCSVPYWSAGT